MKLNSRLYIFGTLFHNGLKKIIFRHVLPNALVATMTFMPFTLAGSVTVLTSLDFLGIGLPPGSASLGELLAQGVILINEIKTMI